MMKSDWARKPLWPCFILHPSSFAAVATVPPKKWRDLIQQVWHTDPLICPQCQHPMRVIAVIDQREVVEKILRHLGLWNGTPPLAPARAPPDANVGPWTRKPFDDMDPMPACRAGRRRSAAQAGPITKTSSATEDEPPARMFFSAGLASGSPVGCAPQRPQPVRFSLDLLRRASARPLQRMRPCRTSEKARKTCLTPAPPGRKSPEMNPTQKQFSLNRAASKKQIPISYEGVTNP